MKIENTYEIVKKLIGNIEPIGETNTDAQRLENLKETIYLTNRLINDILEVAKNQTRQEYSILKAGIEAQIFKNDLRDLLAP